MKKALFVTVFIFAFNSQAGQYDRAIALTTSAVAAGVSFASAVVAVITISTLWPPTINRVQCGSISPFDDPVDGHKKAWFGIGLGKQSGRPALCGLTSSAQRARVDAFNGVLKLPQRYPALLAAHDAAALDTDRIANMTAFLSTYKETNHLESQVDLATLAYYLVLQERILSICSVDFPITPLDMDRLVTLLAHAYMPKPVDHLERTQAAKAAALAPSIIFFTVAGVTAVGATFACLYAFGIPT